MEKNNLTLCLMVKNEAKGLRRAVESARSLVREVIIGIDMLSDDDTIKIARELTPCVFFFRFNDNFADIRNQIMKAAQTDWILWLDGHEYLKEPINLAELAENDHDGFLMRVELETEMMFMSPRIVRKDVLYSGAIHEAPQMKNATATATGLIKHDRVDQPDDLAVVERKEHRKKMMLADMVTRVKKDKRDLRALLHLGIFYQSEADYKKAADYYRQFLQNCQDPLDIFIAAFNSGLCYIGTDKIKEARCVLDYGLAKCGEMWELNFLMGVVKAKQGQHIEAIACLLLSQKENTKPQRYFPIKRYPERLWDQIANEFYQLKEYEKAATAWTRASELMADPVVQKLYADRSDLMLRMEAEKQKTMS